MVRVFMFTTRTTRVCKHERPSVKSGQSGSNQLIWNASIIPCRERFHIYSMQRICNCTPLRRKRMREQKACTASRVSAVLRFLFPAPASASAYIYMCACVCCTRARPTPADPVDMPRRPTLSTASCCVHAASCTLLLCAVRVHTPQQYMLRIIGRAASDAAAAADRRQCANIERLRSKLSPII